MFLNLRMVWRGSWLFHRSSYLYNRGRCWLIGSLSCERLNWVSKRIFINNRLYFFFRRVLFWLISIKMMMLIGSPLVILLMCFLTVNMLRLVNLMFSLYFFFGLWLKLLHQHHHLLLQLSVSHIYFLVLNSICFVLVVLQL